MQYDEKLIAFSKEIKDLLTELKTLLNSNSNTNYEQLIKDLDNIYQLRIANLHPKIMVYGIYNAGKSSIINELLKEDKAPVADKPTTDTVTSYSWNNYYLDDTPGVGAPIAHEEITEQHLKLSDIVLFVMSSNGSNERRENYERLKTIIDAGKKVIIVLNDKDGILGRDDMAIEHIKTTVYKNMQTLGIENVDSKYEIIPVNAARAKKGRLENKSTLYEKSNFKTLETVIMKELKKSDVFKSISKSVDLIVEKITSYIQQMQNDSQDSTALENLLQRILEQKNSAKQTMDININAAKKRMINSFSTIIYNNLNISSNSAKLSPEGQQQLEDIAKKLENQLISELQATLKDCNEIIFYNITKLKKKLNLEALNEHHELNLDKLYALADIKPIDIELSKIDEFDLSNINDSSNISDISKALAPIVISKLPLPILTPIPPTLVPIIFTLLQKLLGGGDDERRKAEAAEAKARAKAEQQNQIKASIQNNCELTAEEFGSNAKLAFGDAINAYFDKKIKIINELSDQNLAKEQQELKFINDINSIIFKFETFKGKLS